MSDHPMDGVLVPPNSLIAEQGVIGGLMLNSKTAWPKVQGIISAGDFYRPDHQLIFKAICKLVGASQPVDVITVYELLKSRGRDEAVGGLGYLANLAKDTPSAANVGHYAEIVRDMSVKRAVIALAAELGQMAYKPDISGKEAIAKAETAVFDLAQQALRGKPGFRRLKHVLQDVVGRIEANLEKPSDGVLGVSSGFADLDELIRGYKPGDLIIVAGRPAMGKSVLALNKAQACAQSSKAVAVFSLEMPTDQLGERMLSSASGVGLKSILSAWELEDHHWPMLTAGINQIGELPLFIDDTGKLSLSDIRARCMSLNAEIRDECPEGLGMIVIDYLQLMGSDTDRQGNRNNEIEDITRGLKAMAKEFGVPVVCLSQLNRSLESRMNKRPIMSDLRDSGGIEQDADIIIFVYRDEVYNPESPDVGIAELIVGKHRNGPLGTVRLAFDGATVRFRDLVRY